MGRWRANIYVIGPVTGMPGLNRAAFEEARAKLTAAGYDARIPHDFIPAGAPREQAMRMSLHNMLDDADGVALLDGWIGSEGARTEYEAARACGIEMMDVRSWVEFARKGARP